MPRIQPLDPGSATGPAEEMFAQVEKKMGKVPNVLRTVGHSPAALQFYLGASEALSNSTLNAKLREQISLAVSQVNECGYCLAAHTMLGKSHGLDDEAVAAARIGKADDERAAAAIEFAQELTKNRGNVGDEEVKRVRDAGLSDGEIADVVALVAINTFTNYFNHVAATELDFPAAPELKNA